jgi:hypothetical protein
VNFGLIVVCIILAVVIAVAAFAKKQPTVVSPNNKMKVVEIQNVPDKPRGFGYKCLWIAVQAPSARVLAESLGLHEMQVANWHSGLEAAYEYPGNYIFVTPPVNGWVLAVGNGIPDPSDPSTLASWRAIMASLSKSFGDTQYFASHRVSSYYAWARYLDGTEKRLFAHADEIIFNIGQPYAEESDLITHLFDSSCPEANTDAYWERKDLRMPDEEDVLRIASKWSINPAELDSADQPPSVGVVGKMSISTKQ